MSLENSTKVRLGAGLLGIALIAAACSSGTSTEQPLAHGRKLITDITASKAIDPATLCGKLISLIPDNEGFTPYIGVPDSPAIHVFQPQGQSMEATEMSLSCVATPDGTDGDTSNFLKISGRLPVSGISKDRSKGVYMYYSQDTDTSAMGSEWRMEHDTDGIQYYPANPSAQDVNAAVCGDGVLIGYDPNVTKYLDGSPSPTAGFYCGAFTN